MKIRTQQLPPFEEGLFTQIVREFIFYKRSCGLKYEDSAEYVLRQVCYQLNQYSLEKLELTQEMVFKIVEKRPHEQYSTQSRRITYVRQFAKYLNQRGYTAYIYPEISIHREEKTFVPYLFTDEEVKNILSVIDSLTPSRRYPYYHRVYPTLIRLLYSSGLRLSEALHLKIKSFDPYENTILIQKSKNCKSRSIPLSSSMAISLKNYLENRFGNYPDSECYIFEAPDGNLYNRSGVRATIYNIFKRAGLPVKVDEHHPNVHSFRHNYAVRAMEKMQAMGMDLYHTLPLLSVYLGHKGIRETEKYLRLPRFRMNEIAHASKNLIENMIPEVTWDEE